jgi:hypothetical protein
MFSRFSEYPLNAHHPRIPATPAKINEYCICILLIPFPTQFECHLFRILHRYNKGAFKTFSARFLTGKSPYPLSTLKTAITAIKNGSPSITKFHIGLSRSPRPPQKTASSMIFQFLHRTGSIRIKHPHGQNTPPLPWDRCPRLRKVFPIFFAQK